jgi:hypothetical protein
MSFKTCIVKTGDKYYIISIIYITTNCGVQLYVSLHPNPRQEIVSSYPSVIIQNTYTPPIYSYVHNWRAFPPLKTLAGLNVDKHNLIYIITSITHIFSSLLQTQCSNKTRFHVIKLSKYSFT